MRLLVCLLLAVVATAARADWEKISENDTVTFYVDFATIRKDGDLRRVSSLSDLKKKDPAGQLSQQTLDEYDCKGKQSRILSWTGHAESMGKGVALLSFIKPTNWSRVAPGSIEATMLEMVCSS